MRRVKVCFIRSIRRSFSYFHLFPVSLLRIHDFFFNIIKFKTTTKIYASLILKSHLILSILKSIALKPKLFCLYLILSIIVCMHICSYMLISSTNALKGLDLFQSIKVCGLHNNSEMRVSYFSFHLNFFFPLRL